MTCKISFFKTIKETLKHHVPAIFATCLIFFIQFISFFISVQNYAQEFTSFSENLQDSWVKEALHELTQPTIGYMVPIAFVAMILAFDFFRYLHSKKQVDFYESLPMNRKTWFRVRTLSSFLIFVIPFTICIGLEMLILGVNGFATGAYLVNLTWNYLCMILIFLITWFTGVLCMILTGNSIIALFGFGTISLYVPVIIRYLYDAYASQFFHTYLGEDVRFFEYLTYLSPFGCGMKLLSSDTEYFDFYSGEWQAYTHILDFIIIAALIVLLGCLTYVLFLKRPSEASARAMTFEKANPIIRIMLVVPLSLYLGLFFWSTVSVAPLIWTIFGFIIGCILIHGIIESIFQFDIRGMLSHKLQMLGCFIACIVFASIFWFDIFGYNTYVPKAEEIEYVKIDLMNWNYSYSTPSEDRIGIRGNLIPYALTFAEDIIAQDITESDGSTDSVDFEYRLKDGTLRRRTYVFDSLQNTETINQFFATEDFKDDYNDIYHIDVTKYTNLCWYDYVDGLTLQANADEIHALIEAYKIEYSALTYEKAQIQDSLGYFSLTYNGEDDDSNYEITCEVYPQFTETIKLLDQIIASDKSTSHYRSLTENVFEKYELLQLRIYCDEKEFHVSDAKTIKRLSKDLIYQNTQIITDWSSVCDVTIQMRTKDGVEELYANIKKDKIKFLMQ